MPEPKNGKFKKEIIYYTVASLKEFASKGRLDEYCLWLLLKREYESGHFHSKIKPQWYTKSQSQFYRDLISLKKLGLIKSHYGGFVLTSLKKITGCRRDSFAPKGKLNTTFKELVNYFIKELFKHNYLNQLKHIVLKELKYTWNDLKVSKPAKKMFRKLLRAYRGSKRAFKFIERDSENKTSLSCHGAGKLFGKSAYYGWMLFKRLIEEGFLQRFIYYQPIPVKYNSRTELDFILKNKREGIYFYKGMFFNKPITTFIVGEDNRILLDRLMRKARYLRNLELSND